MPGIVFINSKYPMTADETVVMTNPQKTSRFVMIFEMDISWKFLERMPIVVLAESMKD